MASDFVTVRLRRSTHRALVRAIRTRPEFVGPPRWTLTDVLDVAVLEFIPNEADKVRRVRSSKQ